MQAQTTENSTFVHEIVHTNIKENCIVRHCFTFVKKMIVPFTKDSSYENHSLPWCLDVKYEGICVDE